MVATDAMKKDILDVVEGTAGGQITVSREEWDRLMRAEEKYKAQISELTTR